MSDGIFVGGLGGLFGGLGGQPHQQQALMNQSQAQMFAQLQAQQQFNMGQPLNGLSDLLGARPASPAPTEPEPEPVQTNRAWGLFVMVW